jgi:flagellar biosynthesis protein
VNISDEELRKAVALYFDGTHTPTIIAKGEDALAQEIIELAVDSDVPICDNAVLADFLSNLDIGEQIPSELYQAVACVLAFAYKVALSDMNLNE